MSKTEKAIEEISESTHLNIYGKTSNIFNMSIMNGRKRILEYDGYPIKEIVGDTDGISIDIDIETGQILNWNLTKTKLQNIMSSRFKTKIAQEKKAEDEYKKIMEI